MSNYGVPGYGTDQAYLRFVRNRQDSSEIVILGHCTENVLRNVNRYRGMFYYGARFGFKPRFVLGDAGSLTLIPLPNYTYDEFSRVVQFPEENFSYEYFIPGGPSGIYRREFPYTLTLVKALMNNCHIRAIVRGVPWYQEFYKENHPSKGLLITAGILKKFCSEAQGRKKRPLVLIIPTGLDLLSYQKHGVWPYENLVGLLQQEKIEFLDAGPEIITSLAGGEVATLFRNVSGHFNKKGYELLANIVYRYLVENHFLVENSF